MMKRILLVDDHEVVRDGVKRIVDKQLGPANFGDAGSAMNWNLRFTRIYENHLDARWRPGAYQETRQLVRDSLSRGYNVAVHVGHGYRNVMSVGDDNLTNGDAMALSNGDRLLNLYAINCTSNAIDFPCIGEAFIHAQDGGAVTNIGSSTLDFPYAGRAYQKNYFELLYHDSVSSVGEAQAKQKL